MKPKPIPKYRICINCYCHLLEAAIPLVVFFGLWLCPCYAADAVRARTTTLERS